MDNPNPYNDAGWSRASGQTISSVEDSWANGASLENIEEDVN